MADNESGEEPTSRGNEWEVVSLTASAYAAAKGSEASDDSHDNTYKEDEAETSKAMFMSGHFVFPPSQHENLPLEPEDTEIQSEHNDEDTVSDLNLEQGDKPDKKGEEDCNVNEIENYSMSLHDFESSATLQDVNLTDKEQTIYSDGNLSSFHSESTIFQINSGVPEIIETFDQDLDSSPKSIEEEEVNDGSDLPCKAWWKRHAGSLYDHAKEANTFWSICIAATVMGLVILGHRWHQERLQKMGKMMGPVSLLKDVIVGGGGSQRGSFIRGSVSGEL